MEADMPSQPDQIPQLIRQVEAETGHEFSRRERDFALGRVRGLNKADAAREAGVSHVSGHARGYEMEQNPAVQELIARIRQYSTDLITDDFLRQAILQEALHAEHSRDRREALKLLMQTRGMLRDVVEHRDSPVSDEEYLERIGKEFGKEARQRAAEGLGLDDNETTKDTYDKA